MIFQIADTFTAALAKLDNASQKAAKICAIDLQMDPSGHGKQFHKIDKSKDKNFWSVRASRDIRLIVHKVKDRFTLCYVDHHDDAYDWAVRRVFEIHPKTRALQIVEVIERVKEIDVQPVTEASTPEPIRLPNPLAAVSSDELLSYGVPLQWVDALKAAGEERLLDLAVHLPSEASEAVLALAIGETPIVPLPPIETETTAHPDEQRRFRIIEDREELEQALDYPWDKWSVFLHPTQREFVERNFNGPARVAGSAGTGKTVVAVHRAMALSKEEGSKVLLTTFSQPLASSLAHKIGILNGDEKTLVPNIHVTAIKESASDLYELMSGHKPFFATEEYIKSLLRENGVNEDQTFLWSEWNTVIDAWQIKSETSYLDVARIGRRSRIGSARRSELWPIFQAVRNAVKVSGRRTKAMLFEEVSNYYAERTAKPYTNIIVDEAQDLDVADLKFLAAIAPKTGNALFFAGDLGQRIFKLPFSWKSLGVDVRGRSATLKVNYRTSHQVRASADKLLPDAIRDMDGLEEDRRGTVSVFNGPIPEIHVLEDQSAEHSCVEQWLKKLIQDETPLSEIGIFVRTMDELHRIRAVASRLNLPVQTLNESLTLKKNAIAIGTMHLAKGLEFRCVAVMACDDNLLPLESRVESIVSEEGLDEVYVTERHLLYVACTRAREKLLVTGVKPESDFLADLSFEFSID